MWRKQQQDSQLQTTWKDWKKIQSPKWIQHAHLKREELEVMGDLTKINKPRGTESAQPQGNKFLVRASSGMIKKKDHNLEIFHKL